MPQAKASGGKKTIDLRHVWVPFLDEPKTKWAKGKERSGAEEFCAALDMVKNDPRNLALLPRKWRDSKSIVTAAVWNCSYTIWFASSRLRKDKSLISLSQGRMDEFGSALRKVNKNPENLQRLAFKWRDNKTIVAAAISLEGDAWHFASERLRCDRALVLLALARDNIGLVYLGLPQELYECRDVALVALRRHGVLLAGTPSFMHDNPRIIATAGRTFEAMRFAPSNIQADKDIVLEMVKDCYTHLIGPHIQSFVHDDDFLEEILKWTEQKNIVLCRVTSIAGHVVVTSFPLNGSVIHPNSIVNCLGLHRLFHDIPTSGSFIFENEVFHFNEWITWILRAVFSTTINLDVHKINEIQIVLHE